MIAGQVTRQAIAAAGDRILLIRPDDMRPRAKRSRPGPPGWRWASKAWSASGSACGHGTRPRRSRRTWPRNGSAPPGCRWTRAPRPPKPRPCSRPPGCPASSLTPPTSPMPLAILRTADHVHWQPGIRRMPAAADGRSPRPACRSGPPPAMAPLGASYAYATTWSSPTGPTPTAGAASGTWPGSIRRIPLPRPAPRRNDQHRLVPRLPSGSPGCDHRSSLHQGGPRARRGRSRLGTGGDGIRGRRP